MRCYSVVSAFILFAGWIYGQSSRPADEAAIREQFKGYAAARSNGDGNLQAAFYSLDADEWGSGDREMTVSRAEIARKIGLPPDPNRKVRIDPIRISFLSADVALVDATYGGTPASPTGHAFYVMVKREGKWLIRANRVTRFPAPATK